MKKKFVFFLILIGNLSFLLAQPLSFGVKGDILIQNKNMDYEFGSRLVLDYQFENLPFSLSSNLGFRYAELSPEINLSTGYTKTTSSLGVVFYYYPIKWDIEPYIGLGLFYNANNISKSGTGDDVYVAEKIKNNIAYTINGGIKFSASSSIHFITEVIYSINNPDYTMKETNDFDGTYVEYNAEFDFKALYLSLGLMFDI